MLSVFKNVRARSTAKNYYPVSFLSVVSKVFEKLVNNNLIDHLFSDFRYCFWSSQQPANFVKIVSNRIASAYNRSWATRAVALDISKAFARVWHAGLKRKPTSHGTSGQIFRLILSFLSNRGL